MLLHGFLSAITGKTKHRPVKLKNIQLICVLMCILAIPEIAHAATFEYKAVFSAPCVDIMTLSTPVPELSEFTVCTYIKLASSNPWTAFTYQLPTSSINVYEFGVLGDSSSLKIWMFGTQINVFEKLNLQTWYEICIMWSGKNESMGFYLDGNLIADRKLENKTKLVGGGSVVLGCSHFKEINASVSVGVVGEMYMFRMWNTTQTSLLQNCNDGDVIKWKKEDWIYSSNVVQQDSSLHCAKEQSAAVLSGQINNNIHMLHKRSAGGPEARVLTPGVTANPSSSDPLIAPTSSSTTEWKSTGAAQVDSTETKTLTSGSNTFSAVQTTNISSGTEFIINSSSNSTLWTSSSSSSSFSSDIINGNDTSSNFSTFSTASITTNINNGNSSWSSSITSQHTYSTSDFFQTTSGSMNCVNDSNALQNWYLDICNTTSDRGSAYEIVFGDIKGNCKQGESEVNSVLQNYTVIMKTCSALVFGINDTVIICELFKNASKNINYLNKIDYYCCHKECSYPSCIASAPACVSGGVTGGFQSTADNNVNLSISEAPNIGSDTTVNSAPSTTAAKGSSASFSGQPITNIVSDANVDTKPSITIASEVTENSKSSTSTSASTNIGSNGAVETVKSESAATGDQETITTINSKTNGTGNTESYTPLNSGSTGTTNSGSNSTANGGSTGTTNSGSNSTANSGSTGTTNSGSNSTANSGSTGTTNSGSNSTTNSGSTGTSNSGSNSTNSASTRSTNSESDSTTNSGSTGSTNSRSDSTTNSGSTGSTNSRSDSTTNSGSTMTTISKSDSGTNSGSTGTTNSRSNSTSNSGSTRTASSGSNSTTNSGPMITVASGINKTANSGPTITSIYNTTVNTEPASTFHSGSTTTYRNNDSVTITVGFTSLHNTTIPANITDGLKDWIAILSSPDLNSSTVNRMVSKLEEMLSGDVSPGDSEAMLNVLNSFLNVSQTLLGPVSNRLIKIVDKIGLKLTFPGPSINITSQSLALAVAKVNDSSFTGTSFGINSSSGLQVSLGSQSSADSDGSILLPASIINDLSPGDKKNASRLQFNYYAKTSFFTDPSLTTNQQLVSTVISSSVANLSLTNLSENVTVTLKTTPKSHSQTVDCVFWDFTKNNESGGWSSYGCLVANTTRSETVCRCNHLTSFAILMNVSPNDPLNPKDVLILTFITYIGCGLSAIFLSVTLVTYIAFEKIRRDYPSKILIQLCAALVGLNLTFLLNPWIALYNDIPGLCISVAAFLHYFFLVSITWMGLEAFHMYLSLVKVFNTYVRKYILKFCIIAWVAPAVVVAIILAVNKDLYFLQTSAKYPNGSTDYFCWVNDTVFWITIVGYYAIIFLLNVSMFVVVLIQLCRIKRQKQLGYQRKTTLQDIRSVAGITFLLGITWGLGFFSFGPGRTVIIYLFTIFNTLQGFFIFFFYCVAKENVRKQWRRYLCCGRFRLAENSDWSKTATNKLRKQTSKQGVSSSSSNSIQSTSNTNSTTLLVSNEYSLHPNGNGNVHKERNGVSFILQNGEMPLQELAGRPSNKNGDVKQNAMKRTSNRGSVHFVDQI